MSKNNYLGHKHPIAIVGMGCIFPNSRNLKEYWHLLFNGIDAIQDIPGDTHWKIKDYYSPDPSAPDHTYCTRGGFLPQISFDPSVYGIPPNNLEATDTSQLLGLEVARMALNDAGYPLNHPALQQKKVNVILGVTGTQELVIPLGARLGHPIWKKALEDSGISAEKQNEILARIQGDYVPWQENSFPGLLGNVVAGRIANRLNLSGTNTVTDAACASSLSAVHTAIMELVTGKCDMSITGGVDALNDIFMHMCFSKTGVLSHTSDAKPFSKDADGTVLGEGIGMLVLKRLEDAQKDKDRIYAVIKGVGTSSDGRTSAIYAPDAKGQLKALEQAYSQADIDPSSVGLVEAHGTGTRVGDKVEFNALKQCFNNSASKNRTALGSVKSMIGHTKAAAGAAGIIKAALSLYNKTLPPTLKATEPDPELDINHSAFYLNSETRPWVTAPSSPRRCGVSAFGFGGSNFHVVLEEYSALKNHISWDGSIQILAFSSDTRKNLISQLNEFKTQIERIDDIHEKNQTTAWLAGNSRQNFSSHHDFRLLIVLKKEADAKKLISQAVQCIDEETLQSDIYFSSGPKQGKLGFLFPGQGSQYPSMGKELCSTFPQALTALEQASFALAQEDSSSEIKPLSDYIFPPPKHLQEKKTSENQLRNTRIAQPAIGGISLAMIRILKHFGISPDMTCGHSFGELSALLCAGWMEEDTFLELSAARGKHMANASSQNKDPGSMLAIRASLETIQTLIEEEKLNLVLANRNSHDQGVLSGPTDQIKKAAKICAQKKLTAIELPVAAAFHSKFVKNAAKPFIQDLSDKKFKHTDIPVLSNTTGKEYGIEESDIRETLGNQLIHPVNFLDNIEHMFQKGVSTFVEVGPKSVLTGLSKSILKGKKIQAISMDASSGKKSNIEDLAHVLCLIASNGFNIDLVAWEDPVQKPVPQKMKINISGANLKPKNRCTLPKSEPMSVQTTVQPIAETQKTTQLKSNDNRSPIKGSDMTFKNTEQHQMNMTYPASEAMQMVQKGLEAMQQLQTQTARAHEKFLETQAQATKTLASMMEQTQHLVFNPSAQPGVYSIAKTLQPQPPVENTQATLKTQVQQTATSPASGMETPQISEKRQPQSSEMVNKPSSAKTKTNASIEPVLFEIVSKLTGFPVEMLEADMNIESDLGIDSIKKVEIISELEKQIPECEGLTSENIGSVRTLKDICLAIQSQTQGDNLKSEAISTQNHSQENDSQNLSDKADRQTVAMVLMDTISELTGFPVEMLEPSMNLESDLGIDSIKRVEILSKLEQQLDHIETISSDDIAGLKTIEEIILYLSKNEPQTGQTPEKKQTESQKKTPDSGITPEKTGIEGLSDKNLSRQAIHLKKYPTNQIRFYNGARIELSKNKKVYITKDSSKIALQFKTEFEKIGITADLIDISNGNVPVLEDASGIVVLPDISKKNDSKTAVQFIKSAFELAKKNAQILMDAGGEKGAFFTTVSFLGGGFGFDDIHFKSNPIYGGLAGLAKTAKLEWKNVLCRALDMPVDKEHCLKNAEAAVALMLTHGAVEMGLDGDSCNIPTLEEQNLTPEDTRHSNIHLSKEDVIVITGGAKGVTAACAIELSRTFSPSIILIGRSAEPSSEPQWCKNINEPALIKKAILTNVFKAMSPKPVEIEKEYKKIISNREIIENIARMEKNGSRVKYFSADIKDTQQIEQIFSQVRKEFGSINAVIHGAGVLEDKLIIDKHIDQFTRVLETKIIGLDSILHASRKDTLKYLVLFSSVAARSGNTGQCDYAMANEILNKSAQIFSKDNPDCKYLSINWGPWEGGMVDASLKNEFLKRGIELIPIQAGAKQLILEMGRPITENPEIVIGAHLFENKKSKDPKLSKALTIDLGLAAAPILHAHKIDGKAVVPFALLMECMAFAAERNNPGLVFAGMDNLRLLKGIKPQTDQQDIHIHLGKCLSVENGFQTPGNITSTDRNGASFIHSSCTVRLKERLPKPPVLSKAAFMELTPYPISVEDAYEKILFHGKPLQGITSINGYSKKGIEVTTCLAPAPDKWFTNSINTRWVIEPMMLDAAFQAAILWSYEKMGQVCLPNFIANLRLYSSFQKLQGNIRILFTVNEETKNRINGYFTFLNEDNIVIASITGFEAITDPSLNEKFKKKPLFDKNSILAFAQGNPSEAFGEKYKIFDKDRQIARLPRPPYFFMDRVTSADHIQWKMKSGGWIEAQYDIPKNEWYFKANNSHTVPFAILLEIALQPCGWLAAYAGSALESDERLYFRNLGGKARLIRQAHQDSGTLTMRSRMKEVSKAGGMIIQDFDMEVLNNGQLIYAGTTNFGFFSRQALSNQVGIRNSKYLNYLPSDHHLKTVQKFKFKNEAPLTPEDKNQDKNTGMPSKALRMIDEIDILSFDAGFYDNGYIKAVKKVNPKEWFFNAHFYQDPVCPGSLGVESFLQMIRFYLIKKYDIDPELFEPQITVNQDHEWIYRGQITPLNKKIEIHAHIKQINEENNAYTIVADGALVVDGICIYEMKDFGFEFNKINQTKRISQKKSSDLA